MASAAPHRRRFSAAPPRQSQIQSGETFVRVFANRPLGLAVLANHRIGQVVKLQQGDYAGVQAGDTILEVDQKRVDPYIDGHEVALLIKRAQVQRVAGRVELRLHHAKLCAQLGALPSCILEQCARAFAGAAAGKDSDRFEYELGARFTVR